MIYTAALLSILRTSSSLPNDVLHTSHLTNIPPKGRRLQAATSQIVFNSRGGVDRLITYTGVDSSGVAQFDETSLPYGPTASAGATFGDLNGDGHLDMIRGTNVGYTWVMYNDGYNGFPASGYSTIPKSNRNSRDYSVRVADIDKNGLKDIITGAEGGTHFVYKQTSLGVFSPVALPVSTNTHYGFAVADFNNDSYPDIAFSNKWGPGVQLLLNDGTGNFPTAAPLINGGTGSVNMVTEGDFDGDGDIDLVSCSNRHVPDKLYVNDGSGTFTEVVLPGSENPSGDYFNSVSANFADLNGDGHVDIVIGRHSSPNIMLLNDGSGNYPASVEIPSSPSSTKILKLGDVNGDGSVDIVAQADGHAGYLFLNDGSANFARQMIVSGLYDPWGLAVLGAGVVEENGGGSSVAVAAAATPTASPTKAPWEINYVSMDVDFGAGATSGKGEVDMTYLIPTDRVSNANHYIYRDHCNATVTQDSKIDVSPGVVTTTNSTMPSSTALYDKLEIFHRFNKTLIAESNIWFNETNEIRLCQVVEMIETHDGEDFIITQGLRNVTIEFNLTTGFAVDVNLTGATILAESANTTLDDYVSAWYCEGDSRAVKTVPLAPNEKLHICVKSSSTDVELEAMTMIKIVGTNDENAASELTIVQGNYPVIPSITSHTYLSSTEYVVETMVPIGFFNFEAVGATIDVIGSLTLNLVGERRRLEVSVGVEGRELQEGDANAAGFDVSVPLAAGEGEEEFTVFSAAAEHGGVVAGAALALGLSAIW